MTVTGQDGDFILILASVSRDRPGAKSWSWPTASTTICRTCLGWARWGVSVLHCPYCHQLIRRRASGRAAGRRMSARRAMLIPGGDRPLFLNGGAVPGRGRPGAASGRLKSPSNRRIRLRRRCTASVGRYPGGRTASGSDSAPPRSRPGPGRRARRGPRAARAAGSRAVDGDWSTRAAAATRLPAAQGDGLRNCDARGRSAALRAHGVHRAPTRGERASAVGLSEISIDSARAALPSGEPAGCSRRIQGRRGQMSCIEGFVIPVPTGKKEVYREMAAKAVPLAKEYGATHRRSAGATTSPTARSPTSTAR